MKPLILTFQEPVVANLTGFNRGPKTLTDSREGRDCELNTASVSLGTETFTKARENSDSDFHSPSNGFC